MEYTTTELTEAMHNCKQDIKAFTPVYEAYVDRIYSYCLYRVNTIADAEDLTSQVFARAMERCHTFRGGNVGAWLFRIAYHITIDHYRTKQTESVSDEQLAYIPDQSQRSPLETVIHREQLQYLDELLTTLDEDKRNLLLLRITGNLTSAQVGEIVGKSATSVRVEIYRIIQQLKKQALLKL